MFWCSALNESFFLQNILLDIPRGIYTLGLKYFQKWLESPKFAIVGRTLLFQFNFGQFLYSCNFQKQALVFAQMKVCASKVCASKVCANKDCANNFAQMRFTQMIWNRGGSYLLAQKILNMHMACFDLGSN